MNNVNVDPKELFEEVERQREVGTISDSITSSPFKFQGSKDYPGFIERIDENGNVEVGRFRDGVFEKK